MRLCFVTIVGGLLIGPASGSVSAGQVGGSGQQAPSGNTRPANCDALLQPPLAWWLGPGPTTAEREQLAACMAGSQPPAPLTPSLSVPQTTQKEHPANWNRLTAEQQATFIHLLPKDWREMTPAEKSEWESISSVLDGRPSTNPNTEAVSNDAAYQRSTASTRVAERRSTRVSGLTPDEVIIRTQLGRDDYQVAPTSALIESQESALEAPLDHQRNQRPAMVARDIDQTDEVTCERVRILRLRLPNDETRPGLSQGTRASIYDHAYRECMTEAHYGVKWPWRAPEWATRRAADIEYLLSRELARLPPAEGGWKYPGRP